ncbi:hypothetical protein BFJ70_g16336 [Fusarium oxysporum]|nr:hypothetical protein BFJ70_g16336 [Fusarium oxysporum]
MKRTAGLRKWEGTPVAEVYVWLEILIYMGIHKERTIKSHWSTPSRVFKIWVIAQQGFFIRWLWYIQEAKYSTVGVEHPQLKSPTQGRGGRRGGRGRGAAKAAGKKPATEDKSIALNSTESVVVALANMLLKATYQLFVDNLFSSSDLFRSLRKYGHGATGTARPNYGIHKELQQDKKADGGDQNQLSSQGDPNP